jgi:propionyl-CoA carboxylase alpha chain
VKAERARKVGNGGARNGRKDWVVIVGREQIPAHIHFEEGGAEVSFDGKKPAHLKSAWVPGQPVMTGEYNGAPFAVKIKEHAEGFVLRLRGVKVKTLVCSPRAAELHAKLPEKVAADTSKMIISPMPGLVVAIEVSVGQEVKMGESVAIVEAMKMQNIIRAERDGVVKAVNVAAGASVAADEVLVELA